MQIIVINGPNLNFLGRRDKKHYGNKTLDEINDMLQNYFYKLGCRGKLKFFQSNHEGDLIDFIQKESNSDGMIINPGALSHYSYALRDALCDFKGKKVEVHLSNVKEREGFRKNLITAKECDKLIYGKKEKGYLEALKWLVSQLKE